MTAGDLHWMDLSFDERLVLPNVSGKFSDPVYMILRRVRECTPLTSNGQHKDFGERRLRKTLRSLEARCLVVTRGRTLWTLHIHAQQLMDDADVRTGLRRRLT